MTKVVIEPGVCGFLTKVTAESVDMEDQVGVKIQVESGCESVQNMMKELGEEFDAYELCLQRPGVGPMFDYAKEHFPVHVSCPILNGIIKCVEAECNLALKKDTYIRYED